MPHTSNPAGSPTIHDLTPRPAQSDSKGQSSQGDYKNFEDLAGKLMQVPKSEIDEKRQKS